MTSHPEPRALDTLDLGWVRMQRLVESALRHATAALPEGDPVVASRRLAALGETVDVRTAVDLCLVGQCALCRVEHTVSIARQLALRRSTTGS